MGVLRRVYKNYHEHCKELFEFDPVFAYDFCDAVCDHRVFFGDVGHGVFCGPGMAFHCDTEMGPNEGAVGVLPYSIRPGRVVHGLCTECGDGVQPVA